MKLILLFFILFSSSLFADSKQNQEEARTAVHLLSYMAQDYAGAVEEGKIKDQGEYSEQLEFAEIILKNLSQLKKSSAEWEPLEKRAHILISKVKELKSTEEVSPFALELKNAVIILGKLATSPNELPSLLKGKNLFASNCVACHGNNGFGDGPDGKDLQPVPTNFHGTERPLQISPFGAFNTIKLGVNGTAMVGWGEKLSDGDIWALSYYVTHLRYNDEKYKLDEKAKEKISGLKLSLDEASTFSDLELARKYFQTESEDHLNLVAALRVNFISGTNGPGGNTQVSFVTKAQFYLLQSEEAFHQGDSKVAHTLALNAYLEGIEPIEPQLKKIHPESVRQIELHMSKLRQAIKNNNDEEFRENFKQIQEQLDEIKTMFDKSKTSDFGQFAMSMGIVLREGLEAMLIVATILTVINAFQIPGLALWVHAGWMSALALGVLSWKFSGIILGGMERELMEGLASYFAVLVLLSMGLWLHSKTEIDKWKALIKNKTKDYIGSGKLFGIASISFIATFREVFETVVFLRALTIEGNNSSHHFVLLGFLSALILVLFLAYLFIKLGAKLPLSKIFTVSSGLMLILAIILAGKGTHALQEAGIVSLGPVGIPTIEILGIYPSFWPLFAQLIIAILAMLIWFIGHQAKKNTDGIKAN